MIKMRYLLLAIVLIQAVELLKIRNHNLNTSTRHSQKTGVQSCQDFNQSEFLSSHKNIETKFGQIAIISQAEDIPKGWSLLPMQQIQSQKEKILSLLSMWSIVGLLDGKIDGSGFGNGFTHSYGSEVKKLAVIGDFDDEFMKSHETFESKGQKLSLIDKNDDLPCGARLVTIEEIPLYKEQLLSHANKWDIIGLLNGKIDGSGYGGKIKKAYGSQTEEFMIVHQKN